MTEQNDRWIEFPCLEVSQPIGTFYVGVLKSSDLLRLSYSDVRRIHEEEREVETYLGIERPLNESRVREIKKYVTTLDASFPSAIILAVSSGDAKYDAAKGVFRLSDRSDVAKVLDGQHRIAGLEGYDGGEFELLVTLVVDMDIENQALLFATINLEQTKVSKSLAYDLYEYAKARSPQKTAHNIVRLLDSEPRSPLQGKIKMLGSAVDPEETLSQATLVDALLPLISKDPMRDRDLIKRRKDPPRATPDEERTLIFRNMFLDKRDAEITRALWNYFGAVEDKWGQHWRERSPGNILNRTTGFWGLMLFLPHAYLTLARPGQVPTRNQFKDLLDKVKLEGPEFTSEAFTPGSTGRTKLRDILLAQTGLD